MTTTPSDPPVAEVDWEVKWCQLLLLPNPHIGDRRTLLGLVREHATNLAAYRKVPTWNCLTDWRSSEAARLLEPHGVHSQHDYINLIRAVARLENNYGAKRPVRSVPKQPRSPRSARRVPPRGA